MATANDYIASHRHQLLHAYLAFARRLESARGLAEHELVDNFPEYLDTLQRYLAAPAPATAAALADVAQRHIDQRLRLGYNQQEVTEEYQAVARSLFALWEERAPATQPPAEELQLLMGESQRALDAVTATFSGYTVADRQQEKRDLLRLERVAHELLTRQRGSLLEGETLQPLLSVVREAVAAEAIALYLYEPEQQRLELAAQQGAERTLPQSAELDASLLPSQLVQQQDPIQLTSTDGSAPGAGFLFRHHGPQSLLGARMFPYGRLLGVLYVGFRRFTPASSRTKRHFSALIEELSVIIDRARLIDQQQASNSLLESIVEHSGEGVVAADAAGIIRVFNPAAERQHGVVGQEVGPTDWTAAFGLLDLDEQPLPLAANPLARAMAGETVREAHWKVRRPDGAIRLLSGTATPLRGAGGAPAGAVLVIRDETRRAADEAERERLLAATQVAVQSRDDLLAVISHDLRNPLGSIQMSAELIERQAAASDGGLARHASRIKHAARHMARLIGDLVDLGAIERGSLSLSPAPLAPARLLAAAASQHQAAAADKGIELRSQSAEPLPLVRADHDRLLQVLSNLLGNAINVCSEGDRVTLTVSAGDASVIFEVEDTGPGIPAAEQERIFAAYHRGNGSGYRGSGLGLHIAKAIVEAHGGRLWLHSSPGAGSRFYFSLPRADG